MERLEVLVSSDTGAQLWNSCVWDVHSATPLMTYRGGGVAAPRTLNFIGNDYVASAERTKPVLHIWPLNSQEQVQGYRLVLPGRATALAFSPDGCYCVAGVEQKIYIWQLASGALLQIVERHYQTVNNIKFVDDGSFFVSTGEDGLVLVWSMIQLLTDPGVEMAPKIEPLYSFSDHSLPVTDLHLGINGMRSRLITVSADRSCKLYDLSTGELLLNIAFDKSLTSVAMDLTETHIYVGTTDGDIYQFSIANPPRTREYHFDEEQSAKFSGHTKAVTCLSCSIDGRTLVSGSDDETVAVWDVPSKQKMHSLPHKGAVTNAFFVVVPDNMFTLTFEPSIVLHSLQRTMDASCDLEVLTAAAPSSFWSRYETAVPTECIGFGESYDSKENNIETLAGEVNRLQKINTNLYEFAVDKLFQNIKEKS